MRQNLQSIAFFLAAILLFCLCGTAIAGRCGIRTQFDDAQVIKFGTQTTYELKSHTIETFGTSLFFPIQVGTDFGQRGYVVNADLHGRGTYKFQLPRSVSKMKITIGNDLVYEGKPILSYNGKSGPIEIAMEVSGAGKFEISDDCF